MIKAFDVLFIFLSLAVFAIGLRRRFRLWKIGQQDSRTNNIGTRIKSFLVEGILHRRILQDLYPGFIHLFIFIGFMVPFVFIVIVQFRFILPPSISKGLSLFLDLVGLFGLSALIMLFYRRYITRPPRLDNQPDDFISLAFLFLIVGTGFILEGLRLSIIGKDLQAWAPIGNIFAVLFRVIGLGISTKRFLTMFFFRIHFFLFLGFLVFFPSSKLFLKLPQSYPKFHHFRFFFLV